jgi:type I restriction enzyme, S subunit
MAGDWPVVRLGDVVDLMTGFPFESRHYTDDPMAPRLLRGDNVAQGVLRWDGAKRWPSTGTGDLGAYWLREGDVILAMDRPWIEAGLKYAAVRASDLPALLVQRVARLRGTAKLDTDFLKHVIGGRAFTEYVTGIQTGTAVPHVSGGQIRDFEFALPPLPQQRAIAHILGTLDDKIELHRRMNETLEAIAGALFKSWFVDFDPVRAKSESRDPGLPPHFADLFPDSFQDSELGEIPTGWHVGRFGDVVAQLRDQENPLSSPDALFRHFSIPAFDEGQSPRPEYGESIKSLKLRVPTGVILLSKLNPEIERVWMVDVGPGERAVCSTEFLVLRAVPPCTRAYAYCLARSPLFRQQIESLVTGTSRSHQRAQVESILNLAVVIPPAPIVVAFDRVADGLLARTLDGRSQSRTLVGMRDALLPDLISGELRVDHGMTVPEGAMA